MASCHVIPLFDGWAVDAVIGLVHRTGSFVEACCDGWLDGSLHQRLAPLRYVGMTPVMVDSTAWPPVCSVSIEVAKALAWRHDTFRHVVGAKTKRSGTCAGEC